MLNAKQVPGGVENYVGHITKQIPFGGHEITQPRLVSGSSIGLAYTNFGREW